MMPIQREREHERGPRMAGHLHRTSHNLLFFAPRAVESILPKKENIPVQLSQQYFRLKS